MQSVYNLYIQFQLWDADRVDRSMAMEALCEQDVQGPNEEDETEEEVAWRRDAVAKKRRRTRKSEIDTLYKFLQINLLLSRVSHQLSSAWCVINNIEHRTILYHRRSRLEFKTSSSCKNAWKRWYASVYYLAGIIYFVSFVYPVSGTVMTDQINKGTHLEWRVYCKNKCAFNTKSLKVR